MYSEIDETETDDGSCETKDVYLMSVLRATGKKEAVLKEDSAEKKTQMVGLVKRRKII